MRALNVRDLLAKSGSISEFWLIWGSRLGASKKGGGLPFSSRSNRLQQPLRGH